MNPTLPQRRPIRIGAAAALLLFHLAAIDLLLSLKSTREHPAEGLAMLKLSAFTKPVPREVPAKAPPPPLPRRRAAFAPVAEPRPPTVADPPPAPDAPPAMLAPVDAPPPAAAPLNLALPKEFFDREREHERHLAPAEEAMRDPRSNKLVLTKQEQIEIDFGQYECIAWQREPDGSIYRGPGRLKRVNNIPMGGKTIYECVK